MSRKLSLLILFGTVVAIGALFFQVVRPFLFPLLFAAVLAVLFRPLHHWARARSFGHERVAAAVVTVAVIAMVLLPLGVMLTLAGVQLVQAGKEFVAAIDLPENPEEAEAWINADRHPRLARTLAWVRSQFAEDSVERLRELTAATMLGATQKLYDRTRALAEDVITFVVELVILILALYYFLADGDALLAEAQRLSPLDNEEERTLFDQFERVCRGVVLGTVFAALVQGALAALGFALVGVERIWLLAVVTMLASFIPFVGAATIWICVVIGLVLEQRYGAAGFLTVYGTIVISGSDNLVKAYAIHDRAQMHPLVALVTVLGALQLVGLWGIFVGPIVAAFFYALLNILRRRLIAPAPENASGETRAPANGEAA